ncbi:YdbL family protein [Desulfosarcina alkanivorans]|nr:YdbL family protein [Desulfosarcina alkanivorans]
MNRTRYSWLVAAMVAAAFIFSGPVFGGDIKSRMKDRLPKIIELKAAGAIGEDNQGFLAFVGGKKPEEELVAAENNDRQRVYHAIARQQGTTAAVVGRRRALQIAKKAKAGEWLQDAGGRWYQK